MRIHSLAATSVLTLGLMALLFDCSSKKNDTISDDDSQDDGSGGDSTDGSGGASSNGSGGKSSTSSGSGGTSSTSSASSGSGSGGKASSGSGGSTGAGGKTGSSGGSTGAGGKTKTVNYPSSSCTAPTKSDLSDADFSSLDDDNWAKNGYSPYFFRKNFWNYSTSGAGTLHIWANSYRCWGAIATSTNSGGKVKSYPDMARGWVLDTTIGAGYYMGSTGMPITVGDLTKAKIRWKMTASGSRYYALWDIYFQDAANAKNPPASAPPVNLMIKQMLQDDDNYEQTTESGGSGANQVTFSGITFRENLNTGLTSGSRAVIELFALPVSGTTMGVNDMTLDLKAVIDHYVSAGKILSTDALISIQAGWEIVAGGTFVTQDFWTALQDEPDPTN